MTAPDHRLEPFKTICINKSNGMDPAALGRRIFYGEMKDHIVQVKRIGLDLAKYVFEAHAAATAEEAVLRKTLRRGAVA